MCIYFIKLICRYYEAPVIVPKIEYKISTLFFTGPNVKKLHMCS